MSQLSLDELRNIATVSHDGQAIFPTHQTMSIFALALPRVSLYAHYSLPENHCGVGGGDEEAPTTRDAKYYASASAESFPRSPSAPISTE